MRGIEKHLEISHPLNETRKIANIQKRIYTKLEFVTQEQLMQLTRFILSNQKNKFKNIDLDLDLVESLSTFVPGLDYHQSETHNVRVSFKRPQLDVIETKYECVLTPFPNLIPLFLLLHRLQPTRLH